MKCAYLFTDGAARGNPGPAGAGFVITDRSGQAAFEGKRYLGAMTNNQAEYSALIDGLRKVLELGYSVVEIRLDSELIVRQIEGEYRVKNEGLRPYYQEVTEILDRFGNFSVRHITREKNKVADRLANRAIDEAL